MLNNGISPTHMSFEAETPAMLHPAQPDREKLLSIICVNWNSEAYLLACIASIFACPPPLPFEIIVVDNASPDGSPDRLLNQFPQVTLIKSDTNLGFAAANNLGFRHCKGEYILLLNPDTEVLGPALSLMIEELRSHPDAGIVGCTLLDSDLTPSTTSVQTFPTILNQILAFEWLRVRFPDCPLWNLTPLFRPKDAAIRVEVIPGACMMLTRDVFTRAGLLTEDYFMYAEDIDLNFKVRQLGFSSYYVPGAHIIHHGGKSGMRQPASQWSTVMVHRAMLLYFRLHHGSFYAATYRATMCLSAVGRLLILAVILPFTKGSRTRWSIEKWCAIFKWAVGLMPARFSSQSA
jgi:hypothetical protein